MIDDVPESGLCLAGLADRPTLILREGERKVESDPQPVRYLRCEVDCLVPHPDPSLTAAMLSFSGEEDRLSLGGLKSHRVAVCPLEAGCCASLELANHIVDVNTLHYPGYIIDEGDPSAVLNLALHRPMDIGDVYCKKGR